MSKIKYEVHYGVPFNLSVAQFSTLEEAKEFISNHVFGESRFCYVQKVEDIDVEFKFTNYWNLEKAEGDKMFKSGIITIDEYNKSIKKKEEDQ